MLDMDEKNRPITNEEMQNHLKSDASFQESALKTFDSINNQLKRMEPMIILFEENKIVKARISKDAKTIILYAGGVTTLAGALYVIRLLFIKFLNP